MKNITWFSGVALSLLTAAQLSAQNASIGLPATDTYKKFAPATLMCRGGSALQWSDSQDLGPPRTQGFLLSFLLAPGPAGAQGLGLSPSQCALQGQSFPADRHLHQVYIDRATATFKTTTGTYAPVTRSTSIKDYLTDINHFWTFDVWIDVTRYSADFTPERHSFVAKTHRRLEVPTLTVAGNTPGSVVNKPATTAAAGAARGGSTGQGVSTGQAQTRIDPAGSVALNPQPLPPKTTVLAPRQPAVLPSGTMQTRSTSAGSSSVNPQGQIQGTATQLATTNRLAAGAGAKGVQGEELICKGGGTPGIGPYYQNAPDGSERQMMYFSPSSGAARADGSGLEPLACSYVDRPLPDAGAQIVLFQGTSADRDKVTQALTSPTRYWKFIVVKGEGGYYEAAQHSEWQPDKSAPLPSPTFTDIQVSAGPRNVEFRFKGPADSTPGLLVVNGPLKMNPDGSSRSEGKPLHLNAVKVAEKSGVAEFFSSSAEHRNTQASDEWLDLIPGAQYHYFLSNTGSVIRQEGDFETTQGMVDPSRQATLYPAKTAGSATAIAREPATQSAARGAAVSLSDVDDRAIIVVGGKQTTAGDFKKQVAARERNSGSGRTVKAVAPKTPPPSASTQSAGDVALQTSAASAPTSTATLAKATALKPAPVVATQTQTTRAAVSTPQSGQPLQQAAIQPGVASKLKMDCETREPRLHVVRGRISSAQQFTVEGACLGTYPGSLELIGQFPGGTLKPTIVLWGPSAIVASIPTLYGVPDHPVALSVVRAPDQKRSDAKRFDYVAERKTVPIPAGNFSPSTHYTHEYSDWVHDKSRRILKRTPELAVFEVRKHPACALETVSAVAQVGRVESIEGSDPVPMDPARITVKWDWHCKYTFTERPKLERELGFGGVVRSDTSCNAAFDVQAWASCPVGIAP